MGAWPLAPAWPGLATACGSVRCPNRDHRRRRSRSPSRNHAPARDEPINLSAFTSKPNTWLDQSDPVLAVSTEFSRVLESVIRGGDERDGRASPTCHQPSVPDPPGRPGPVVVGASGGHLLLPAQKFDPAQAWAAITAMTGLELSILGLLAVWNLCTYAVRVDDGDPGAGVPRAMVMTQATTAVASTVPGGSAIGIGMTYSMLGSWGYWRSRSTTAVLVSGVWNSFISSACRSWPWPWSPSRAAELGAGRGRPAGHRRAGRRHRDLRSAAAQRGRRPPVRAAGRPDRHPVAANPWTRAGDRLGLATVKFRARTVDLVEHRWISITVTSLVSHLSLYAVVAGGPAVMSGSARPSGLG